MFLVYLSSKKEYPSSSFGYKITKRVLFQACWSERGREGGREREREMVNVMTFFFFLGCSFLAGLAMDAGVRKGAKENLLRSDEMMQNISGINK